MLYWSSMTWTPWASWLLSFPLWSVIFCQHSVGHYLWKTTSWPNKNTEIIDNILIILFTFSNNFYIHSISLWTNPRCSNHLRYLHFIENETVTQRVLFPLYFEATWFGLCNCILSLECNLYMYTYICVMLCLQLPQMRKFYTYPFSKNA